MDYKRRASGGELILFSIKIGEPKSLHPLEPSASPMGFNILEMSEEGYVRTGKIPFSNIKNIISYLMHVETEHLNFLDSMMYGYELQTKKMYGYFNFAYSVISPLSTAIP